QRQASLGLPSVDSHPATWSTAGYCTDSPAWRSSSGCWLKGRANQSPLKNPSQTSSTMFAGYMVLEGVEERARTTCNQACISWNK
ncbi:hypothetical protein, partial [Xanthomonas oryzae]|uniref:hypothetical protein n=1 Tax=Xanthomonas oryzae TaxID=347 RepID=UPI001C4A2D15